MKRFGKIATLGALVLALGGCSRDNAKFDISEFNKFKRDRLVSVVGPKSASEKEFVNIWAEYRMKDGILADDYISVAFYDRENNGILNKVEIRVPKSFAKEIGSSTEYWLFRKDPEIKHWQYEYADLRNSH